MIIESTAPARVSLFGSGTDTDPYSYLYGGAIISMSTNIRQHVTLFTEDDAWGQPYNSFPPDVDPKYCYQILDKLNLGGMHRDIRLKTSFDGIISAGLGSSGAFTVALLAAIYKWKGITLDKIQLAEASHNMEVNQCNRAGGQQDHYAASFGGFNYFLFGKVNKVIPLPREWIENLYPYMVLFYIGSQRKSHDIQMGFNELDDKKIETLNKIKHTTGIAIDFFTKGDIKSLGDLLQLSWELKKKSNNVTTDKIDKIYDLGMKNGAFGGKLLGAGAGGHMLFLIHPLTRKGFIEKMKELGIEEIDFSPDWNGTQTRIL